MGNNQVVRCSFCGNRNIPKTTKSGIDDPPPVICYDCVLKFADEIKAEQSVEVMTEEIADFEINFENFGDKIIFRKGRWYLDGGENRFKELPRSRAKSLIIEYEVRDKVPEKIWLDLEQPDQPRTEAYVKAEE